MSATPKPPAASRPGGGRPEPDHPEAGRPEPDHPEGGRPEADHSEAGRPEPVRPQAVRPQAGRAADEVESVTSRLFRLPMPRPWGPDVTTQDLIVTRLRARSGATGTGFSWTVRAGGHATKAMIDADAGPAAVGGPVAPEAAWDRLWWHLRESGGGITTLAMAAVDIALWDLCGRVAGLGLPDLIGRQRDVAAAYASGVNRHLSLAELTERTREQVAAGHTRFKLKVGLPDLDADLERVAAVRQVIGERRLLMVDANQLWDLPQARRAARALAPYDIFWLEEPLAAEDFRGYADLRRAIDIPLAAGESLYTEAQFRELLLAQAVDFVQPNVCRVGGITPFLRIARLARQFSVPVAPHLLPDISGQLAMCLPLAPFVEDIDQGSFAALGALARPSGVVVAGGMLRATPAVGHGLEFATDTMPELTY